MAKLFECKYEKYSQVKTFSVAATTIRRALDKAEVFVKKDYGKHVVSLTELRDDVEIDK